MTVQTYKIDGIGWVVADEYWLEGTYADEATAIAAAKLDDAVLVKLRNAINRDDGRVIKMCDLPSRAGGEG